MYGQDMSPRGRFVVTAIYADTSQIIFLIWQDFALTLPPLVFMSPVTPDAFDNGVRRVPIVASLFHVPNGFAY